MEITIPVSGRVEIEEVAVKVAEEVVAVAEAAEILEIDAPALEKKLHGNSKKSSSSRSCEIWYDCRIEASFETNSAVHCEGARSQARHRI